MDIARERRVLPLFGEALDWPAASREERLRGLLAAEPEVLAAGLSMLRADQSAALIPTTPPEPVQLLDERPPPQRIGNYRIVEENGRGGMGLVYRAVRDDGLRAVAAKAAEQDPVVRYGTVAELMADLDRWQGNDPVMARPPDRRHALLLMWRRNRLGMTAAALLLLTALAMTVMYLQASNARDAAEQRFAETRELSNFLVSDVVTQLETMPGTGPMRQRIADQARVALERLSHVPGAPVDLQIETANAYARVGETLAAEDLRTVMDPVTGDAVLARAERDLRQIAPPFARTCRPAAFAGTHSVCKGSVRW